MDEVSDVDEVSGAEDAELEGDGLEDSLGEELKVRGPVSCRCDEVGLAG